MAVAVCPAPIPAALLPRSDQHVNERFYKFGTPSPAASPPVYSDLEDSGFHTDEEMQKVCSSVVFSCSSVCCV